MPAPSLTRREFQALGLASLAGLALGRVALGRPEPAAPTAARQQLFDWKAVSRTAWVALGQGGNALLIAHDGQSVLIDTKNAGTGATLRREASGFGSPVGWVINTHHHGDHVGGNPAFRRELQIIAHKNAIERCKNQAERLLKGADNLAKQLESGAGAGANGDQIPPPAAVNEALAFADTIARVKPEDFAPTKGVEGGLTSMEFGGLEMHLHHAGPGHTDNDLFIFVPALNTLHTGDLVFHKRHPFIDAASGATTTGWQESCRAMLKLCKAGTIVIPGHGDVGTAAAIQGQIEYFDTLRRIVRHAKDVDGMSRDEVTKLQTGAFEGYGFEQLLPRALGAVYDELVIEKGGTP